MEPFSLLKYWRSASGDGRLAAPAVSPHFTDTETGSESDTEDDGPFFDLEFSAATEDEDGEDEAQGKATDSEDIYVDVQLSDMDGGSGSDDDERELKPAFSPASSASNVDGNNPVSPRDGTLTASEADSKIPASLLKSTTKFKVLMLKLKKTKQTMEKWEAKREKKGKNHRDEAQNKSQKRFFRVKLKVEDAKIKSLFKRESSSNSNAESSEEAKSSKEMIQKYLKSVRSFSGRRTNTACPPPQKPETGPAECSDKKAVQRDGRSQKRAVPKTLGKSRSASSAPAVSHRRDDSLKEQHDGIQGAILHCKRSFNSSPKQQVPSEI